jgi:hypothetical protein
MKTKNAVSRQRILKFPKFKKHFSRRDAVAIHSCRWAVVAVTALRALYASIIADDTSVG